MFRKTEDKNGHKRHKPEEIVSKLRRVEVLVGQRMPRTDASRQVRITEKTYYRGRMQCGGMGTDQLKELKRIQNKTERLRKAVYDLALDKLILLEAAKVFREAAAQPTFESRPSSSLRQSYPSTSRRLRASDLLCVGSAPAHPEEGAHRAC